MEYLRTPSTKEKWKDELARLPNEERAELARFLIESLDDGEDPDADEAWEKELPRHASQIKDGTAEGEPAEDVMMQLHEKHS